jgi:hypothetical protein
MMLDTPDALAARFTRDVVGFEEPGAFGELTQEPGSHAIFEAVQARVSHAVQKTGISKQLKSTLRHRLIQSLQHEVQRTQERGAVSDEESILPTARPGLAETALFSLVVEFLRSKSKMYSLSVLLPECGMTPGDILTQEEVGDALALQRLHISATCPTEADAPSQLERILGAIATLTKPLQTTISTQTDDPDGVGQSLDQKLLACEKRGGETLDRRSVEERMLHFQTRCEARCRKEADMEIARIRTIERERIALEESAKSRAAVQEAVHRAERESREREQRFRTKEAAAIERLRAKELDLEKRGVEWRAEAQKLLSEGSHRQETRTRRLEVEESRVAAQSIAFDQREREVSVREGRLDERLSALRAEHEAHMHRFKASVEADLASEREAIQQRELALEREGIRREREREHQNSLIQRLASAEQSTEESRTALQVTEAKVITRDRELADVRRQLDLITDLSQKGQLDADRLRGEIHVFQREVEAVRGQKEMLQQAGDMRVHAAVKSQAQYEAQTQGLERENTRLAAELEHERSRTQRLTADREETETRVRASPERGWESERVTLGTDLERLRHVCADAASHESVLKNELRKVQEQCRDAWRETEELRRRVASEAEQAKRVREQLADAEKRTKIPAVANRDSRDEATLTPYVLWRRSCSMWICLQEASVQRRRASWEARTNPTVGRTR